MGKNEIKAVEMTRQIRDAHYEQLKEKSAVAQRTYGKLACRRPVIEAR
jgi:hypothetical protein